MYLIQVYDDHGEVKTTAVVDFFPYFIGRSPNSNLRIGDPSVSARHAVLEMENGIVNLRNLSKTNGIVCEGKACDQLILGEGREFYLGKVKLVLTEDSSHQERTQEISIQQIRLLDRQYLPWYKRDMRLIASGLGVIGISVKNSFMFYDETPLNTYALESMKFFFFAAFAATGLAVVSKLNKRGFRFKEFFTDILMMIFCLDVLEALLSLRLYVNNELFQTLVDWVPSILVLYYFLFGLSKRLFPEAKSRTVHIFWGSGVAGIVIMWYLQTYTRQNMVVTGPSTAAVPYPWWSTQNLTGLNELRVDMDSMVVEIENDISEHQDSGG